MSETKCTCENIKHTKDTPCISSPQPKEDWLERFRDEFHNYTMDDPRDVMVEKLSGKIEDFVRTEIEVAEKRGYERGLSSN